MERKYRMLRKSSTGTKKWAFFTIVPNVFSLQLLIIYGMLDVCFTNDPEKILVTDLLTPIMKQMRVYVISKETNFYKRKKDI
jgi:hypothetical protein